MRILVTPILLPLIPQFRVIEILIALKVLYTPPKGGVYNIKLRAIDFL